MASPLYPTFSKRINDSIERLIRDQVTPWAFLTSGKPLRLSSFNGKLISYQNIGFEGSPEHVFWGRYIEPFLEHICVSEITAAVAMAKERGVDARQLLPEIKNILKSGCKRVYDRMAEIDQNLRGKGYPNSVSRRSIDNEFSVMAAFIDTHISAELEMWKPKSKLEHWYSQNRFWVWAISALVGVVMTVLGKLLG